MAKQENVQKSRRHERHCTKDEESSDSSHSGSNLGETTKTLEQITQDKGHSPQKRLNLRGGAGRDQDVMSSRAVGAYFQARNERQNPAPRTLPGEKDCWKKWCCCFK